ncbi:MAG: hypothetical protein KGO02_09275 [Alphaproteobacteria bacterium]|nr:hypothetical protein [Alphaproteobacteria bacterium]
MPQVLGDRSECRDALTGSLKSLARQISMATAVRKITLSFSRDIAFSALILSRTNIRT